MEKGIERTAEFLKAAEILLPIIKACISKDAIRRHSLQYEAIIKETILQTNECKLDYPNAATVHYMQAQWQEQLQLLLAADIPFYLSYGVSKRIADEQIHE